MLVVMQQGATEAQIQKIIARLVEDGFDVHRSTGVIHTVLGGVGGKDDFDTARRRTDGGRQGSPPHRFAVQAGQPRLPARGHRGEDRRCRDRRRQSRRDGRPVQRGEPRSDRARGGHCGRWRRERDSRRRVQAALFALQFSGPGRRGPEAAARSGRPARPAGDQRSDGRDADSAALAPMPTFCRSARATCRTSICCANSASCASRCC